MARAVGRRDLAVGVLYRSGREGPWQPAVSPRPSQRARNKRGDAASAGKKVSIPHSPYKVAAVVSLEARRSRSARCMRGESRAIAACTRCVGKRRRGRSQGQRLHGNVGLPAVGAGARHGAEAGVVVDPRHCHRLQAAARALTKKRLSMGGCHSTSARPGALCFRSLPNSLSQSLAMLVPPVLCRLVVVVGVVAADVRVAAGRVRLTMMRWGSGLDGPGQAKSART